MRSRLRQRFRGGEQLSDRPDYDLVGVIRIPELQQSPGRAIGKRVIFATVALFRLS